jgi:uncharacterized protein YacL
MLIEAVRLVVTLAATAAGFSLGRIAPDWTQAATNPETAAVVGAVIGAGIGYVVGGLVGRLVRRSIDRVPAAATRASGAQLFAGAFGFIAGLIVGAVAAVPAIVLLPEVIGWPSGALLVIVLASTGARVFTSRSEDLLAAAGLVTRRRPVVGEPDAPRYLIDSSAAIDGRVLDLARSGLLRGEITLPGFVVDELQGIADSGQVQRRRRGRRGLDVLEALSAVTGVRTAVDERTFPGHAEVDAKLLALAVDLGVTLITTDHNLVRAAGLRGIEVLDPQAISESLRSGPMAGEIVSLIIEKAGTEPGQGVGYLEDGTMVVVEDAASLVGRTIEIEIAGALRTSIGRLLFAKLAA